MHRAVAHGAIVVVVCGCLSTFASAWSQDHPNEPSAIELIGRAREFMASARTIRVDIKDVQIAANERGRMEIHSGLKLQAEQPNKLNLVTSSAQGKLVIDGKTVSPPDHDEQVHRDEQFRIVSDGEHLYSFWEHARRYTKDPAPAHFGGAFDRWDEDSEISEVPQELAVAWLVLFQPQFPGDVGLLANTHVVGVEAVDGHPSHHVHFDLQANPEADRGAVPRPYVLSPHASSVTCDIWIEQGDQPLIRKIQTSLKPIPSKWNALVADTRFDDIATFENWRLNEAVPADSFVFTPPNEATEVVSLIVMGSNWPLLGSALSPFNLDLLGGGTLNSAQQKGTIMVLVFWNGVGDMGNGALPALLYFASRFQDHGVATYLVGARQSDEAIKQFLEQRHWTIPVALDGDGSVSRPQLGDGAGAVAVLVVGRDGTIQAAHGDYFQDAVRLRAELASLIAGRSIIEELPEADPND